MLTHHPTHSAAQQAGTALPEAERHRPTHPSPTHPSSEHPSPAQSCPAQPARVVVLGATGFLASRVIALLQGEGIPCRPVGSAEVDLIRASAMGKLRRILSPADSVVVCSALTPEKGRGWATLKRNLRMVEHLCTAIEDIGCAHVVYVSSDSVYDPDDSDLNEDSCCDPADMHGLGHIVRERMLGDACRSMDCPLAIIRSSAIYGAGDTHNSYGPNRFVRSALATGRIALFGDGEEERDHVYIDDVARILQGCLMLRSSGLLNAVSGRALSFRQVALCIAEAAGRDVAIETLPRSVPIRHRRFDAAALRQAFPGFEPTPLAAGIRRMIAELRGSGGALLTTPASPPRVQPTGRT